MGLLGIPDYLFLVLSDSGDVKELFCRDLFAPERLTFGYTAKLIKEQLLFHWKNVKKSM